MNSITFQLPSDDINLVRQVYTHLSDHTEDVDTSKLLTNMAKKYRFAGYIGTIDFLFDEIKQLRNDLEKANEEIAKLKKQKRPWLF